MFLIHSHVAIIIIFFALGLKIKYDATVHVYAHQSDCSSGMPPRLLMDRGKTALIRYSVIVAAALAHPAAQERHSSDQSLHNTHNYEPLLPSSKQRKIHLACQRGFLCISSTGGSWLWTTATTYKYCSCLCWYLEQYYCKVLP